MIKYTWDCKTVEVRPLENSETDVVYNVNWKVTGTSDILDPDGTAYSAIAIGEQILTYNPDNPFIPFSDLTNEIVTNWTKSTIGDEQISNIEDNVQSMINELITPITVTLEIPD
tara:strand:- start:5536 stop:5877 length:342 start_codon:yes stop_codon:yes gene_type:complete